MAQHDYDINSSDAISGLQFRADVNAVLSAIKSGNSGATAPVSNVVAGMTWYDTSATPAKLKIRNTGNTAWVEVPIESVIGAPIASGATTTVGAFGGGEILHITGTTTITSLGVSTTGTRRTLIFDGVLTLTHNATSLICLGAENIVTIAGTIIEVICEDGAFGYWRVTNISHPSLSMAELGYLDGVTSSIQSQLDLKAPISSPTFTGSVSLESSIIFEGSVADAFETTLTVANPTADRTVTIPDNSGTVLLDTTVGLSIQVANYTTGAVATGTTQIPYDDTIPQNTEGTQFMSLAFTPKLATSKLRIDVVFNYGSNNGTEVTMALFRDSGAGAIAAVTNFPATAQPNENMTMTAYIDATAASLTTFNLRAGPSAGATTITFNGAGGARKLGGVYASSITITEIAQ